METVWLVDSCLPPDGIPQVAEPLRAPPLPSVVCASFIGAWRGAREELDLVEWLQLSEARFSMHPFPVDATSTSRVDVSLRRVCQMYSNFFYFWLWISRILHHFRTLLRCKIETIKYPPFNASRYIFYSRICRRERERERKIGDA